MDEVSKALQGQGLGGKLEDLGLKVTILFQLTDYISAKISIDLCRTLCIIKRLN